MNRQDDKATALYKVQTFFNQNIAPLLMTMALWAAAVHIRGTVIRPKCSIIPTSCTASSIPAIDRVTLGIDLPNADLFSFYGQNSSGVLGFLIPLFWTLSLGLRKKINWTTLFGFLAFDATLLLQTICTNGLLTEISHLVVQRPRPFVYSSPTVLGADPANYTSFYSGHTSFSAATLTAAVLILIHRKAPAWLYFGVLLLGQGFIFTTGHFRILASRHFLTDVICGGLAGTLAAWFVCTLSYQRTQRDS